MKNFKPSNVTKSLLNLSERFDEKQMNTALQELIGKRQGTYMLTTDQQELLVAISADKVAIDHSYKVHGADAEVTTRHFKFDGLLKSTVAEPVLTGYSGSIVEKQRNGDAVERTLPAGLIVPKIINIDYELFNGPQADQVTFTPATQAAQIS